MIKSILTFGLVTVSLLTLLAGCVFAGTATLRIRNELTSCRTITALFLYEQGDSDKGSNIISSLICPNESHTEYRINPGEYTIEAEIEYGAETAIKYKTLEEDTHYTIYITDSDI